MFNQSPQKRWWKNFFTIFLNVFSREECSLGSCSVSVKLSPVFEPFHSKQWTWCLWRNRHRSHKIIRIRCLRSMDIKLLLRYFSVNLDPWALTLSHPLETMNVCTKCMAIHPTAVEILVWIKVVGWLLTDQNWHVPSSAVTLQQFQQKWKVFFVVFTV